MKEVNTMTTNNNIFLLFTIIALLGLPVSSFITPRALKHINISHASTSRVKTQIYNNVDDNFKLMKGVPKGLTEDTYKELKEITQKFGIETSQQFLRWASFSNTIFDDGSRLRKDGFMDIVQSPALEGLMDSYYYTNEDLDGEVMVVYAPSDVGKSVAAEFLLHGEHGFRPSQALKFSARDMDDFENQFFKRVLGRDDSVLYLHCWLLECVLPGDVLPQATMKKIGINFVNGILTITGAKSFQEETALQLSPLPRKYQSFGFEEETQPVLVLDDFNCYTKANMHFLRKLYDAASRSGVRVFILTNNAEFATEMASMNGGSKIRPIAACVDNAGYVDTDYFTGTPEWNYMLWSPQDFRNLVSPFVEKHNSRQQKTKQAEATATVTEVMDFITEEIQLVPPQEPPQEPSPNLFSRIYRLFFKKKPKPVLTTPKPVWKPPKPQQVIGFARKNLLEKERATYELPEAE